jgi:Amidase
MFNGCVGVKPTVGRLSTLGVVPAARALDCVTVFSQTVADGAAVARLMEVRACPRGRHRVVGSAGVWQRTVQSPRRCHALHVELMCAVPTCPLTCLPGCSMHAMRMQAQAVA